MLKTFRKLVKQFQSIPERDFPSGRTKDEILADLGAQGSRPGEDEIRRLLFAHDPDIRQAAVRALESQKWRPGRPVEKHLWAFVRQDWDQLSAIPAAGLLNDWESEVSLTPGGYWTAVVLGTLVHAGEWTGPEVFAVAADERRSVNTKTVALWALGLRGQGDVQRLAGLYRSHAAHQVREAVLQSLRFQGVAAVPELAGLLAREQDEELGLEAALALAWIGSEAVPELLPLVEHEARLVREFAALSLLGSADPQGLAALHSFKASTRDGRMQTLITECLTGMGGDGATWRELNSPEAAAGFVTQERIVQAISRQDDDVLLKVLLVMLGHVRDPGVAAVLQDLVFAGDAEGLLFEICMTLSARIQDQEAAQVLHTALRQGNPLLRTYACLALILAGIPVMSDLAET